LPEWRHSSIFAPDYDAEVLQKGIGHSTLPRLALTHNQEEERYDQGKGYDTDGALERGVDGGS
jgi:hypothetical protein